MEIVRNHKLSIPSRSKYKLDKIGVGEALFVPAAELKDPRAYGRLTAAAYHHGRDRKKKFYVTYKANEGAFVVRGPDPKKD